MLKYLLFFYIIFNTSFDVHSKTKEYFVVLNKPIDTTQSLSHSLKANKLVSGNVSAAILNVLKKNNIESVKLFSRFVKGLTVNNVRPLQSNSNEEYTYLIDLDESNISDFIEQVKHLDEFIHVQPNFIYTTSSGQFEPKYESEQKTGFELMKFPDVWQYSTGSGVVVAVLDTGILVRHVEFCNGASVSRGTQSVTLNGCTKIVSPYDAIDDATPGFFDPEPVADADYEDPDGFPEDFDGHGTHVAGIIAASVNGTGMTGAAYGASIMPIRVLAPYKVNGEVVSSGSSSHIIAGINYAVSNGADIINMSLGGVVGSDEDLLLRQAIDNATVKGVLVIAAAGNSCLNFDDAKVFPAYFENAMSVASVNKHGVVSAFSNYGESLDVAAWGGQASCGSQIVERSGVYSAFIDSNTSYKSFPGTSMATPFVSALAAIIKSYYLSEKGIKLTPAEIRRLIQLSAERDTEAKSLQKGYGIINAKKALVLSGETALIDDSYSSPYIGSDGSNNTLVCYPNPFKTQLSSSTSCNFFLTTSGSAQAWIYSRRGQLIKQFSVEGVGRHSMFWDGRDQDMNQVPNGVYQMVLKITPENTSTSPMTLRHLITVLR